jgi:histidyl-tRNA synthetase
MMYQKPKGTRDIYGRDLMRIETVCSSARSFFRTYGYQEIRTPVFEYADLFIRSIGETTDIVEKENYAFELGDRRYMLRPEGTASVLRAIIENKISLPQRFLYIEPMFRKERPQKGRYREFIQIGIEHIGEIGPLYDAEMIEQGKRFLDGLGMTGITIEVNSIGCPECRTEYKKLLNGFLQPHVSRLCTDCVRRIERNFLRIFDCKNEQCQRVYDQAPKITDSLCTACAEHYAKVKHYLKMFPVLFIENKKLVRGLDYYTRTVFEFKSGNLGSQDTILAGGRYDILMKELGGPDAPALGWAMGVDRMLLSLPEGKPAIEVLEKFFLVVMGETLFSRALDIRKVIHDRGYVCILGDHEESVKHQLKKANKLQANYTVIFGEDEARENACTIKDMQSGKQEKVLIHALDDFLAKKVRM